MRYITTTDTNITFTDVDGKVKIVPKNRVYTHFNVDTVTFLLIERYDNEGICLFSTKASDLQINGETYTYQELLDGEGISDLFSPTGLSFEVVEELPQSGEEGTIYLVPNDHDTYTEYIWIAEEEKWEAIGDSDIDLSNYYTKSQVDALIPTNVSDLTNDAGYITQAEVVINESYPSAWLQSQDMEDLIQAINDDSDAVVGKVYMDTISLSDLPASMQQAEVKVEIMSELQGEGKVLLFTVTSSNTSPYHWEYTSAYGETGTWREWATAAQLNNYYDKTTSDGKYATQTVVNEEIAARIAVDGALNTALQAKADKTDTYTKTQVDTALNGKQDTLTAGTGISIQNNVISATGGTQVQSDWNQSDSSAVDYIKNKPTIPDTSDFVTKAEYNPKEVAIANALTQLNDNKADKTELPDTSTFATKTELNGKQDTLTAGQNITIQNNVISATGGGGASYQFYTENDEEQEEGTTINRHKDGVIEIADEGGTTNSGMGIFFTQVEEDGSISYTQVNSSMYANKDDGETVNGSTIDVEYNYASISVTEDGEDNGTQYSKYTDFIVNPDSLTVEVSVDGVTATQLELNDSGLSINGNEVLTEDDAYTKTEIDAMIGNIQTILASI